MSGVLDRLRAHERPRSTNVLAGLLAVAVVALAVVWWSGRGDAARIAAGEEALAVATERAVQITTYTAETVDDDFAWVDEGATDSFAAEYAEANEPLRAVITTVGARASGVVTAAAADVISRTEVEVVLFVDQTIVQGPEADEAIERNRVVMTMVDEGGRWLVDDVELR